MMVSAAVEQTGFLLDQTVRHEADSGLKRAGLCCGRGEYTLVVEKCGQWRDIERTFGPERTILR